MKKTAIISLLIILMAALMLPACTEIGAEAQVKEDLEAMRDIQLDSDTEEEINSLMNAGDIQYYDKFVSKASEFEYTIEDTEDAEDGSTIVYVRITTYNFGKAYLTTWTEYIEELGDGEFDQTEFYGRLFRALSDVHGKHYTAEVGIRCTEGDSDGAWTTDCSTNAALRDALFGGLLTEAGNLASMN
jgi:hypothetical protein